MKKFFFISLLISTLSAANAQQTHFGLKGGVNVSQLNVENNSSYDSKIGLFAGVLAHIHASETWALQPELIYSMEGGRRKTGDIKTNLNYINVPVLLQYMFHNGVRLEGGPQLGFLVSARTKTGSTTVDNNSFKSTAFSIPLGIGYLTSDGLGFDARYVFGLSNINKDKNPVVQSNVFQFGIFYQFSDVKRH